MTINKLQNWINNGGKPNFGVDIRVKYACGCQTFINSEGAEFEKELIQLAFEAGCLKFDEANNLVKGSIRASWMCADCEHMSRVKKEFRPDSTLQTMCFSHGFVACVVDRSKDAAIKNFSAIKKNMDSSDRWEICTALPSQKLGKVGMICRGEVTLAATKDLYSLIFNGKRIYDSFYDSALVSSKEELLAKADPHHVEVWVKPSEIISIWVKEDYEEKDFFVEYFEAQGYKVEVVPETYHEEII